ncbi:MAG: LysR family transcriptional regulator [Hyphomicrobiaceae bacterium]
MNFKQLETFYWAVKLGSFSSAALRLNSTQSTISMRIIELERDLGVELFDRTQRSARPTAKGRDLLQYAEEALRLSQEMQQQIAAEEATPGVLRLGVAEVVTLTWLPELVRKIHDRYPKMTVELDEALTHNLIDNLNQGALDLVLVSGRVPGYSVTPVSLGFVEFAWMASPDFKFDGDVLTPKAMQGLPVIALSFESYHHTSIEDWFRAGDAFCRRMDTCKSLTVAASLAAAGLGLTLLPPRCFENEIKKGLLKIVPTDPPFPPVEFTATSAVESMQAAAPKVAKLAAEISDFDKPRAKKNERRRSKPQRQR